MTASVEMRDAMASYLEVIRADYARWVRSDGTSEYREVMIEEFNEDLAYTVGKKYLRVTTTSAGQEMVHSFVVNTHSDSKFPYGTILKPAGWKVPARNFSRGNVFEDVSHVQWVSAH